MDDQQLWLQLKKGDEQALKFIYDEHIDNLGNYARKFSSDSALIEDAIHDLFVLIWNKRETLGMTDSIIKYLCVSLRRDLIRRIQKEQQDVSFDNGLEYKYDFQLTQEDIMVAAEQSTEHSKKLAQGMENLSSRQKEAIYLKFYEEMSYDEICEVMGINYQSVRNLISKGLLELRNYFVSMVLWLNVFYLFY
jgi:RNA polymerase sigma factor (sigma-70 family)